MILGCKYHISVQNKVFLSQMIYTNLSDEESLLNSKYITNIIKSGTIVSHSREVTTLSTSLSLLKGA